LLNDSRAPPSILDVLPGQPVELRVSRRLDEDYVSTPRRGFAGSGSRLGGVVPEPIVAPSLAHHQTQQAPPPMSMPIPQIGGLGMPGAFPGVDGSSSSSLNTTTTTTLVGAAAAASASAASSARESESGGTRFAVDQTKPTTSVQVRLADGTRMVARMNLTHTVGDLRNFINA
jgi:UBX domain-containing protein 1